MIRKYFSIAGSVKKTWLLVAIVTVVSLFASSFKEGSAITAPVNDSVVSKKAFLAAYEVFIHPRCMNCHPAGDVPYIGDEGKLHTQNVKRGKEGKGMYASKCSNCHMDQNQPGLNMPPGNPKWQMPPANMKMVFEGKAPRELAALLLDPAANGNRTKDDLYKHISEDTLVAAGWHPAEGYKLLPMSHEEFNKQVKLWLDNGAYLPD